MRTLAQLRKAPWFGGAALLILATGIASPLGYALGLRAWPLYVGLVAGALLLMGWVERLWTRRPVSLPSRAHAKFRVLPGGRKPDLSKDDSNDNPRWLM